MGRKAGTCAGNFGCLVEMPSHLAVLGTHLQFRGHNSPDARRGQEICHCGQLLEITHVPSSEYFPQHISSTGMWACHKDTPHCTLSLSLLKLLSKLDWGKFYIFIYLFFSWAYSHALISSIGTYIMKSRNLLKSHLSRGDYYQVVLFSIQKSDLVVWKCQGQTPERVTLESSLEGCRVHWDIC